MERLPKKTCDISLAENKYNFLFWFIFTQKLICGLVVKVESEYTPWKPCSNSTARNFIYNSNFPWRATIFINLSGHLIKMSHQSRLKLFYFWRISNLGLRFPTSFVILTFHDYSPSAPISEIIFESLLEAPIFFIPNIKQKATFFAIMIMVYHRIVFQIFFFHPSSNQNPVCQIFQRRKTFWNCC